MNDGLPIFCLNVLIIEVFSAWWEVFGASSSVLKGHLEVLVEVCLFTCLFDQLFLTIHDVFSQECQTEMLAHQASLDYVNQPLQTCSTDEGQRGRYEHNQFAEEQGRLNYQWLSLKESLNSQVRRQTSNCDKTIPNQGTFQELLTQNMKIFSNIRTSLTPRRNMLLLLLFVVFRSRRWSRS